LVTSIGCRNEFAEAFEFGSGGAGLGELPVDESIFPGRGTGDLEIESLEGAAFSLDESPCRDVAESRLDEAAEVNIIHG
jgi:hypothetical protein